VTKIAQHVMEGSGFEGVFNLAVGDAKTVGNAMSQDARLPLISATGSCAMGRIVGPAVAQRMGRSILELGGNNAIVVMDDADLDLAVRAALFSAVGTSGQRCTTPAPSAGAQSRGRQVGDRLIEAYGRVTIRDPLDTWTLMGPVVSERAIELMMDSIDIAREQGGEVVTGKRPIVKGSSSSRRSSRCPSMRRSLKTRPSLPFCGSSNSTLWRRPSRSRTV
jgi:aldehyde dehydrogenase (NAD+)